MIESKQLEGDQLELDRLLTLIIEDGVDYVITMQQVQPSISTYDPSLTSAVAKSVVRNADNAFRLYNHLLENSAIDESVYTERINRVKHLDSAALKYLGDMQIFYLNKDLEHLAEVSFKGKKLCLMDPDQKEFDMVSEGLANMESILRLSHKMSQRYKQVLTPDNTLETHGVIMDGLKSYIAHFN